MYVLYNDKKLIDISEIKDGNEGRMTWPPISKDSVCSINQQECIKKSKICTFGNGIPVTHVLVGIGRTRLHVPG